MHRVCAPPINLAMISKTGKNGMFEVSVILVLTFAIFILDVLTPLGWSMWVLYLIPLVPAIRSSNERVPYYYAGTASALTMIGFWVSPPGGMDQTTSLLNRVLGVTVLWVLTWIIVRQKEMNDRLTRAHEARIEAEVQQQVVTKAREIAETTAQDVSLRASQSSRELLQANLRLDSIVQSAMDGIITVDERQHILLFNEAAQKMFQCPAREAIGQSLDKFIPPRFRDAHRHHVDKFGRSGMTSRKMGSLGTVMGLRADGQEFPIEAAISHITVENDRFFTVILRDISDRQQTERLLRTNEERYRRLLTVSPLAIIVTRGDRVVFLNEAGLNLFKAMTASQILGKPIFELFQLANDSSLRERLERLLKEHITDPLFEGKVIAVDGTIIEVEITAAGFTDEDGPAMLLKLRDVTERRSLQEQLRRTERIAELGTLASGMAHEIGTPMNVILGRAEYLLDRVKDEPVRKGLQTIISQVERITKVMNQLLAFARRRSIERAPIALHEVIENSLDMFQERLAKARVNVSVDAEEQCPDIFADVDQMSQVLINLIVNALHAMPEGGMLRFGLTRANGTVQLTVADTGHGMPADVVKKVFDPFFTTKEFGKGTGLGLTVVKGIIEEHQGSIAVESEENKGTVFTIHLPVHKAH